MSEPEQAPMTERPPEKPPWPKTEEDLLAYLRQMEAWPAGASEPGEGYGRCVYAVAYGALATFNFLASKLGLTGFQASCADLTIVSENRRMEHGCLLLNAGDLLYPQYDLEAKVRTWIEETRPQLADAARQKLAELEETGGHAHPDVIRHWRELSRLKAGA